MKKYDVKTGKEVNQALEAMETKLHSVEKLQTSMYDFFLETYFGLESNYNIEYISQFYTINKKLLFDCDINGFKYEIRSLSRPLTFFDIVFFVVESIAQSKRRLKRRIERLKKTISRRFVDYRVFIRSFANKVLRRNTEEESVLCELDKIKLTLHINTFQLWTKKVFQN